MNRPLLLLLGTGIALGLNFPLGKLAMAAGISPALWAALISAGAGLAMLFIVAVIEHKDLSRPSTLYFAIVSSFLSYVVPSVLTYTVIPEIGSGLAAITFALSPVVTALLSVIFRVRPPNLISVFGIILGLAGAGIIIYSRNTDFSGGGLQWILLALLIPLFLGVGNIFRTMAWPFGASPRKLAAHTNLAAVPFLAVLVYGQTGTIDVMPLAGIPGLVALQLVVSIVMFLMFFRLQQVGGPTYLSQIGYVVAAVGVVIGVFYFGETYPQSVWAGAAVIAIGIAFSTLGQAKQA
ncbi:MAG: DMT family transporter [Aestuariivirga sp.]|nr:DMT family transporter [Aestuariivirga sp.]